MPRPETRYAKTDDVHVAYQVVGDGPLDLVFVPGYISNVEVIWEEPLQAEFLERLASFCRLLLFDKRGTGLSDPVPLDRLPALEDRMEDVRAVMKAAGSERASLFGFSEGGALAALFAATDPDRVRSLVLWGAAARITPTEDYPFGWRRERSLVWLDRIDRGELCPLEEFAPSLAGDPTKEEWWARLQRLGASPAMTMALMRMNGRYDVRSVLPSIRVPTLVLQRTGDRIIEVGHGHHLAEHIPGARLVELAGEDHWPWVGDMDTPLALVQEFLTGEVSSPPVDRVLATVVFTDVVGSTERVVELGDRRWRDLNERHRELVTAETVRRGGRVVRSTGDGFLCVFDGPGRAVRALMSIRRGMIELGLRMRAGVHTGEVEAVGGDLDGIAVNIARRVADLAEPGEVLVSRTVVDLTAGSGIEFVDRGLQHLDGASREWRLYGVRDA